MNMILHGNEDADIRKGDTITGPQFIKGAELRTFDFAVANPPFSVKSWSNGLENDYGRFEFGRPPMKNGDYAFLLHILKSLKSTGKAAVILPHGTLFRATPKRIFVVSFSSAATSRASSVFPPICSMGPASQPASSCSTRKTPRRVQACS